MPSPASLAQRLNVPPTQNYPIVLQEAHLPQFSSEPNQKNERPLPGRRLSRARLRPLRAALSRASGLLLAQVRHRRQWDTNRYATPQDDAVGAMAEWLVDI